jgi:hypothetical protein
MIAKLLQRKTATTGGGGGAFTPSQLTGLQRWYSATDVVTSGSNVTQFNDKSGGSNHATQATGTRQPVLKTNQGSGFQTVSFDGFDDIINFASMTLTGDFTIYWLGYMREADGNGGGFFGEADASLNSLNTYLQGTYWFTPSGDIVYGNNNAITNGLFCEIVARRTGTTVTIEVNGVTNSTSGPVNANPVIGQIGRVYNGYAKVDLAEFLVYNQYHDNATKAQVLSWADGIYLDPYFDKVSLLLHMDGTNGSTTFVDSGPNALIITAAGDAKVSTSVVKFGTGSLSLDGTGDQLNAGSNAAFAFGTGDFTVETFVRFSAYPGTNQIMGIANTEGVGITTWWLGLEDSNGTKRLRLGRHGNGLVFAYFNWTPNLNQWYHIAAVRSTSTIYMFVDGISQTITSSTGWNNNFSATGTLIIGSMATMLKLNGNLDDFRLTKGAARYLANFTPPTAPFPDLYNPYTTLPVSGAALWLDASQQSSLFTDAGATYVSTDGQAVYQWNDLSGNSRTALQTTLANRPLYRSPANGHNGLSTTSYDGTNDFFSVSNTENWGLVFSGDFTIDFWAKFTDNTAQQDLLGQDTGGGQQPKWVLGLNNPGVAGAGVLGFLYNLNNTQNYTFGVSWTPANNILYRITVTRSGNDTKFYINGTQQGATNTSTNRPRAATNIKLTVGQDGENYRYTKGQFGEVLFFPFAYSASDMTAMSAYSLAKWGVS